MNTLLQDSTTAAVIIRKFGKSESVKFCKRKSYKPTKDEFPKCRPSKIFKNNLRLEEQTKHKCITNSLEITLYA